MKRILLNRTSIRKYKNINLESSIIDSIKDIVNSSPSSNNHQKFSVIFIQNQEIKNFISKKNGNQEHIKIAPLFLLFLVDCNRTIAVLDEYNFSYDQSFHTDDFISGAIDATIASAMVQDFCLSQSLGTCYIGGVRFFGKELCNLLNIKGKVTPLLGMTIGYPDETPKVKPKMNKVFNELYSKNELEKRLTIYNIEMNSFYNDVYQKLSKELSFFDKIHNYYLNYKKNPFFNNPHYMNEFLIKDNK